MAAFRPHPLAGSSSSCTRTTRRSARRRPIALGVFFGFSPILGLHTVLGLALAFVFGLNRVAVLLGVYSNLPWILPPYYTLATIARRGAPGRRRPAAGARGGDAGRVGRRRGASSGSSPGALTPLVWAYSLGSTLGAVAARGDRVPRVARR